MYRDFLIRVMASAALATLTACGGGSGGPSTTAPAVAADNGPPAVARIGVSPSNAGVATNGSLQLTTEVLPLNASTSFLWSVSGASCATRPCGTVDATGRYSAPASAPGSSPISVTATSAADPSKSATALITIGPQAAGTFTLTGSMTTARVGHTTTLLADGKVLIAGGESASDRQRSVELYDPASGTFSVAGSMLAPRAWHTATLLADGRVLIVGPESALGAELYDPTSGSFVLTGAPFTDQYINSANLLPNGEVLVAGELRAELYDPKTASFRLAGDYAIVAYQPNAASLADGRVLFVGENPPQLYDPALDAFTAAGSLAPGLDYQQSATLLGDGRVLIAGGFDYDEPVSRAALYDPRTGLFSGTGSMVSAHDGHAAVLLADGQVLIIGGDGITCPFRSVGIAGFPCQYAGPLASIEVYAPSGGSFAAAGFMSVARSWPRATVLGNGDVLITGGRGDCGTGCSGPALASAELYRPR